nr:hypothetical protein [Tanacetum cinerariifolium]
FHSLLDEGTYKSKPLPEGKLIDAKDPEGHIQPAEENKQPADMRLPTTHPDEGISTTHHLPVGTKTDPKDLKRIIPLVDMVLSTRRVTSLSGTNANKTSSEVKLDSKLLKLTTMADIQALLIDSEDEIKEASNDDVFKVKEEMDEDIQEPKETQTHHSTDTPIEDPHSQEY